MMLDILNKLNDLETKNVNGGKGSSSYQLYLNGEKLTMTDTVEEALGKNPAYAYKDKLIKKINSYSPGAYDTFKGYTLNQVCSFAATLGKLDQLQTEINNVTGNKG